MIEGAKISELGEAQELTGEELIPIVKDNLNKKLKISQLKAFIGDGSDGTYNVLDLLMTGETITQEAYDSLKDAIISKKEIIFFMEEPGQPRYCQSIKFSECLYSEGAGIYLMNVGQSIRDIPNGVGRTYAELTGLSLFIEESSLTIKNVYPLEYSPLLISKDISLVDTNGVVNLEPNMYYSIGTEGVSEITFKKGSGVGFGANNNGISIVKFYHQPNQKLVVDGWINLKTKLPLTGYGENVIGIYIYPSYLILM